MNDNENQALEAAKASAEQSMAWRRDFFSPEQTAAREAAYRERQQAKAERVRAARRAAAVARWKGYAPRPAVQRNIYAEDAALLARIHPWDGKKWSAATILHRLLAASEGIFWTRNEKGWIVPLGPMADAVKPGERR